VLPAVDVAVLMTNKPLDVPEPDIRRTFPPVVPAAPAERVRAPPMPLVPDPTVMEMAPPLPEVALPEPMYRAPLLPAILVAVPELKMTRPLPPP